MKESPTQSSEPRQSGFMHPHDKRTNFGSEQDLGRWVDAYVPPALATSMSLTCSSGVHIYPATALCALKTDEFVVPPRNFRVSFRLCARSHQRALSFAVAPFYSHSSRGNVSMSCVICNSLCFIKFRCTRILFQSAQPTW